MGPELLELIAARFKALGEPARLRILQALRRGERTVSDLMRDTDLSQANTSRHLQLPVSWSGGRKVCTCCIAWPMSPCCACVT